MSHHIETLSFLGMRAIIASPAMLRLFETIRRTAASNATVLVRGESGSGKEVVARALHHYSARAQKPWVDLSCAALPEHLVESELFGFDKGAFSGADYSKPGLFELASQGTLFLDEVAELEPKLQVKLLRVLDGHPFYRLGGTKKIPVDVRIVAATNQDLEKAIRQGSLRNDLYHRLAQIEIHVPPLRSRVDDIVPIANLFLTQQNPNMEFDEDAKELLRNYSWPGNVRELRNLVVKCAVLADSDCISASDLPPQLQSAPSRQHLGDDLFRLNSSLNGSTCVSPLASAALVGSTMLEGMEKQTILKAMTETGGHHQRTAELLGISRRTLSRKLRMYERGLTPLDYSRQQEMI
jgi:DNA-binding NtrC family response regulator